MPVRFRRKRLSILLFLLISIFIYLINYYNEDNLFDVKSTSFVPSKIREEFVEINGKKLKKIDWHDYDSIARENVRTGILVHRFFLIYVYCV